MLFRNVEAFSVGFEAPRDKLPVEPEVLELIGVASVAVLRVRGEEATHGIFRLGVEGAFDEFANADDLFHRVSDEIGVLNVDERVLSERISGRHAARHHVMSLV